MGWGRFILAVVVCIVAALAAVWSYFETNDEIKNPKPPPGIVESVTDILDIFFTKPQEVDWRKHSDEPPSYAAVWGCAFVSLLAGAFAIVAGAHLFD